MKLLRHVSFVDCPVSKRMMFNYTLCDWYYDSNNPLILVEYSWYSGVFVYCLFFQKQKKSHYTVCMF